MIDNFLSHSLGGDFSYTLLGLSSVDIWGYKISGGTTSARIKTRRVFSELRLNCNEKRRSERPDRQCNLLTWGVALEGMFCVVE